MKYLILLVENKHYWVGIRKLQFNRFTRTGIIEIEAYIGLQPELLPMLNNGNANFEVLIRGSCAPYDLAGGVLFIKGQIESNVNVGDHVIEGLTGLQPGESALIYRAAYQFRLIEVYDYLAME